MPAIAVVAPYSDTKGNSVSLTGKAKSNKADITFGGTKASVVFGDGVDVSSCKIMLGGNASLEIGGGSRICGTIHIGLNSRVRIGSGTYVTGNLSLRAVEATEIIIGDDCLFGSNVAIRTADGHPIYDAFTRRRVNDAKSIKIAQHVWVADDVLILKGTTLDNACIVGAKSVVTKSFPANTAIAGNPAKAIRTGVTWEHSPGIISEEYYLVVEPAVERPSLSNSVKEAISSSIRSILRRR